MIETPQQAAPDYRRVKTTALQQLATGGDRAALAELQRRGVEPTSAVDVRTLDDAALRALIERWQDGRTAVDRQASLELAQRAHMERLARYRTELKFYKAGKARLEPAHPAVPPWERQPARRCADWQRPTGSKCYRSAADDAAAEIAALAREVYEQRRQQ